MCGGTAAEASGGAQMANTTRYGASAATQSRPEPTEGRVSSRLACKHVDFTGVSEEHWVVPCTQEQTDREQARDFIDTIKEGTPLASAGDLHDSTAGGEPLWLSIANGEKQVADAAFKAAGGTGASGVRTIRENWVYVKISWLVKVKTDSQGNVHYEVWSQPHGELTVLTKPKILTVAFTWLRVEPPENEEPPENVRRRYVMSGATYQRLADAVKPTNPIV